MCDREERERDNWLGGLWWMVNVVRRLEANVFEGEWRDRMVGGGAAVGGGVR